MELAIIQSKIHSIRGRKVMLDADLAEMYQVETRVLNQSVKRNLKRFPADFMFQLTAMEWESMSSQFVMTSRAKRPKSSMPYAFTEQGVAMLSGLLNSDVAILVNISIMRAFIALRQYALGYAELNSKLEDFMVETNMQFSEIYQVLIEMAEQKKLQEAKPRNKIGFQLPHEE
jgi:hypothetical protein